MMLHRGVALAAAALIPVSVLTPGVASASQSNALTVLGAVATPVSYGGSLLDNVFPRSPSRFSAAAPKSNDLGGQATVPLSSDNPVTLAAPGSPVGMSVSLPFAELNDEAEMLAPGVIQFDSHNESSTVSIIKTDGGVEFATIIDGPAAPSRFDSEVRAAADHTLSLKTDASVRLINQAGDLEGGFMPAWAIDAKGQPVSSHYEVDGSQVTQVVDHDSAGVSYPVVAVRAAGYTLLAGTWKNRPGGYKYKNGTQWSTRLSAWGLFVWSSGVAGNTTVRLQGWKEWVNGPGSTSATIHQQYDCHVTYGYAVWLAGVWWDFETARPSRPNWFTKPDKCNWTK